MKITIDHTSLISFLRKAKQWKRRRSIWVDFGVIAAVALLMVAVNHGVFHRHATVKAAIAIPATATPEQHGELVLKGEPAAATPTISASFRPLNFALLRGGFTSVDEFFERVHEDPVLHSFYGDCADRNASMHPLPEDIRVFSTFRKGARIAWANKPLLLRKGEYVMTFCGKTVLARCGNLISIAAMQPSEDIPPSVLETPVDAVEPPLSYAAAPTVDTVEPAAAVAAVAKSRKFFFLVPPFYIPQGSSHSVNPVLTGAVVPPPSTHISGDEFSGHQALFTLILGLLAIGLVKLVTR